MSKLCYRLQLCSSEMFRERQETQQHETIPNSTKQGATSVGRNVKERQNENQGPTQEHIKLPSVNQLAAIIKLTETCKSVNVENYPTGLITTRENRSMRGVRSGTRRQFKTKGVKDELRVRFGQNLEQSTTNN